MYLAYATAVGDAEEEPHLADRGAPLAPWLLLGVLLKMSHAWLHGILMELDQVGVCLMPLP